MFQYYFFFKLIVEIKLIYWVIKNTHSDGDRKSNKLIMIVYLKRQKFID